MQPARQGPGTRAARSYGSGFDSETANKSVVSGSHVPGLALLRFRRIETKIAVATAAGQTADIISQGSFVKPRTSETIRFTLPIASSPTASFNTASFNWPFSSLGHLSFHVRSLPKRRIDYQRGQDYHYGKTLPLSGRVIQVYTPANKRQVRDNHQLQMPHRLGLRLQVVLASVSALSISGACRLMI